MQISLLPGLVLLERISLREFASFIVVHLLLKSPTVIIGYRFCLILYTALIGGVFLRRSTLLIPFHALHCNPVEHLNDFFYIADSAVNVLLDRCN